MWWILGLFVLVFVVSMVCLTLFLPKASAREISLSEKSRVTVELQGGLGNQLFEIATGLTYAERVGKEFVVDRSQDVISPDSASPRPVYWDSVFADLKDGRVPSVIQESSFVYENLPDPRGDVLLKGYFQSWKYISPGVRTWLVNVFKQFRPQLPPEFADLGKMVSIHCRRGDYVGNSYHPTQDWDYYLDAVEYIRKKRHMISLDLMIFSDDPDYAQAEFPSRFPLDTIWIVPSTVSDIQSISLMAAIRDHVLVNSSFSWWGAYLAEEGTNVYPSRWFEDTSIDTSQLCPPDWVLM